MAKRINKTSNFTTTYSNSADLRLLELEISILAIFMNKNSAPINER